MKCVIRLNDVLYLGPDSMGKFIPIVIKSIQRKRMPVKEVRSGQTASFALKKVMKFLFKQFLIIIIIFFFFCLDEKIRYQKGNGFGSFEFKSKSILGI